MIILRIPFICLSHKSEYWLTSQLSCNMFVRHLLSSIEFWCRLIPHCLQVFVGAGSTTEELSSELCPCCQTALDTHSLQRYAETYSIVSDQVAGGGMLLGEDEAKLGFKLMSQSRFTNAHILFLR